MSTQKEKRVEFLLVLITISIESDERCEPKTAE